MSAFVLSQWCSTVPNVSVRPNFDELEPHESELQVFPDPKMRLKLRWSCYGFGSTVNRGAGLRGGLGPGPQAKTVGADKGYDVADFVTACREQGVTPVAGLRPHVAQNLKHSGGSAIDGRTTRHQGYALSQTIRKRIENLFGDGKQHRGLIRQLKVRRLLKASFVFILSMSATNLVRMAKLMSVPGSPLAATR